MTEPVASPPAFAGRGVALATLRSAWTTARRGGPGLVLVYGPPGFGKTALLRHFLDRSDGARTLRATAEQDEADVSYGVLGQLLRGWGPTLPESGPLAAAARGERIATDPLELGVHLLSALDSLPTAGAGPILAVDDLQRADAASLRALVFALRRLRGAKIMSILACRSDDLALLPTSVARFVEQDATRIGLGAFDADETRELARLLGFADLDIRTARQLLAHTGGNPLYLRAVLDELAAGGANPTANHPLPVPTSYARLVTKRLAGCSADAVELVRAASLMSTPRPLSLLAAVAQAAKPLEALGIAVAAGLVQRPAADAPVALTHPLTRAAVYRNIPAVHRAELHNRAAHHLAVVDTLAALNHRSAAAWGPDPLLAGEAGELGVAEYRQANYSGAAQRLRLAVRLSDPASEQYDHYLLHLVESAVLAADTGRAAELRATVLPRPAGPLREYLLARLATLAADLPGAREHAGSAWELTEPDPGRSGTDLRARIAAECARTSLTLGQVHEAADWAQTALGAAPEDPTLTADMPGTLLLARALGGQLAQALAAFDALPTVIAQPCAADVDALVARGLLSMWSGNLGQARSDLSAAAGYTRRNGPLHLHAGASAYLSETAYRLGEWDLATTQAETALELARDLDHVRSLPLLHAAAASAHAVRGRHPLAEEHATAAVRIAEQLGDLQALLWARAAAGRCAHARQDPAATAAALEPLWHRIHLESVREPGLLPWQHLYAQALTELGDHGRASLVLDSAETAARERDLPAEQLAAAGARATLVARTGDQSAALAVLAGAQPHYARSSDRPFDRACFDLAAAALQLSAGRDTQATVTARRALRLFRQLRATPWIDRANALLRRVHSDHRDPGAANLRLTARERHVSGLVASGRTNREIAAELSVSVKTVEYHVTNALAKLGLRSRAELAAWHAKGRTG